MIQSICIDNFKSFREGFKAPLAPFCVFVGPNGAGKSNLVDAFRFVKECFVEGIQPAVTRRYGWTNTRCRRRRHPVMSFGLQGASLDEDLRVMVGPRELAFQRPCFVYDFSVQHKGDELEVQKETASLKACPAGGQPSNGGRRLLSEFDRTVTEIKIRESIKEPKPKTDTLPVAAANRGRLFANATFSSLAGLVINNEVMHWRFYDPNPQSARMPSLARRVDSLSETGDTLALVLHQLRSGTGADGNGLRQKLLDTMRVMVPGFDDWQTKQLADGRIAFEVREKWLRGSLPSLAVSDGTVRLLAILAALLLSQVPASTLFIEEPERSLHPNIMKYLVALIREVSSQTQVIVTTHCPDLVRHCKAAEVYLLDKVEGCTQVVQASSIEQVDEFLKRFSLDQLWLQGYLERGIP